MRKDVAKVAPPDAASLAARGTIADFAAAPSALRSRTMPAATQSRSLRRPLFRLAWAVVIAILVVLLLPYLLVPLYRVVNPVSTPMLWRWATGARVEHSFVPLERMAPALPVTVIASEDGRFCSHRGIDWREISERLEDADISEARGVSTITQQTAKNLFLWHGRSFVRKGLEFPLALWIDLVLPKRRVLEIYLNIAEWGPNGQYGAEAGSRYAFNKIGARAERARGGAARRGPAESAPAQRQAAGTGRAPARRHLRNARRGPGRPRVLCQNRQCIKAVAGGMGRGCGAGL